MNLKGLLLLILAIVIAFYAGFTLWQKSNEKEKQIQMLSGQEQLNKTYQSKAGNLDNYNAQAGSILNENSGGNPEEATPAPAASYGEEISNIRNVNIGKHYGLLEKSQFKKLFKYSASGETRKYDELLKSLLNAREATTLRPGEQVILEETDVATQLVRVKRIGETQSWWTTPDTVD